MQDHRHRYPSKIFSNNYYAKERKIINRYKVDNNQKIIKEALSSYAQDDVKVVLGSDRNWGIVLQYGK